MRYLTFLALILFASVVSGEVKLIDNTDCVALDDPYPCCEVTPGTGNCDGKVFVGRTYKRHVMIEDCQAFWQTFTCADTTVDGVQWLVEEDVCTQQQADSFKRLNDPDNEFMVTCTAGRLSDSECRNVNAGSAIMPKPPDCRKLYMRYDTWRRQQGRNKGRDAWAIGDAPDAPDNTDPIENGQ